MNYALLPQDTPSVVMDSTRLVAPRYLTALLTGDLCRWRRPHVSEHITTAVSVTPLDNRALSRP